MDKLTLEFILRIFVAGLLGGAIGFEREYRAKEAGIRTHFLVALGSALFMILSQYGFEGLQAGRYDISRVAAQVVTGIGFIGAGTIIFQKNAVRGLTTAAGLWVTAAIGMACGSGMYVLSSVATVLVLIILEAMHALLGSNWAGRNRLGEKNMVLTFTASSYDEVLKAMNVLRDSKLDIGTYTLSKITDGKEESYKVTIDLKIRRNEYEEKLRTILSEMSGVSIESIV